MAISVFKYRSGNLIYFIVVLGLICLISASLLSYVYAKTDPRIAEEQKKLETEAMYYVLPSAKSFEKHRYCDCYVGKDKNGNVVGYVFKAKERGYSSVIVLMVGVDKDFKITGIKVLSQNETPGLGTRIVEVKADTTIWDRLKGHVSSKKKMPWFLAQFIGKDLAHLVEVKTISGATISSSAVIRAVRKQMYSLTKCLLEKEKCSVCDK